jgi:hypothetical protein
MRQNNPQLNNGDEHSPDRGPQTDEEKYPSAHSDDVRSDWFKLKCFTLVGDAAIEENRAGQ